MNIFLIIFKSQIFKVFWIRFLFPVLNFCTKHYPKTVFKSPYTNLEQTFKKKYLRLLFCSISLTNYPANFGSIA